MLPTVLRKIVLRFQPGTGQFLVTRPARARWRDSIGGNVSAHHRVSCPVHAGARHAEDLVDHHGAARNRRSPSPSCTSTVTEPQRHSPRSTTGGAGGRAAGEAIPFPRQRSVVGRWTGGRSAARPVGRRHAQAPRAGQRPAAPIDATTAVAAGRDAPRPTAGCGSRRRDSCPHLCQVCGRLGCYLPGIGRGASAVLPHSNAPLPWSSMAGSRRPRDRARVAPRPARVRAYRRR